MVLAFSDNGSGMDREMVQNIFEPFFTTKEIGKGTGLGLSTVYGIVKQNAGFISVYSEPGTGTTFKLYFPRAQGRVEEVRSATGKELPKIRGETVLLVEDEAAILTVGKSMLEKLGYRVLTASTPIQAMDLSRSSGEEIHLLLVDVVMPEMHGRQVAEELARERSGLRVLYMSGYTAHVIAHKGVLEDGVHFLQKPFTLAELGQAVRTALDTV